MLDAGEPRELSQIAITTNTPGFLAKMRPRISPDGPFDTAIGQSRTVAESTTWDLDRAAAQYYVVWITDLDRTAHVNEVVAN